MFDSEAAGDHIEARKRRLTNERREVRINRRVEECVGAEIVVEFWKQARRDVALFVEIEHQALAVLLLADAGDQPAGVSLPHSALEVE